MRGFPGIGSDLTLSSSSGETLGYVAAGPGRTFDRLFPLRDPGGGIRVWTEDERATRRYLLSADNLIEHFALLLRAKPAIERLGGHPPAVDVQVLGPVEPLGLAEGRRD